MPVPQRTRPTPSQNAASPNGTTGLRGPGVRKTQTTPSSKIPRSGSSEATIPADILAMGVPFAEIANDPVHMLLYGTNGVGKCLGKGTPVLLFDGSVKYVEDVEQGDLLMGPNSKPRTVLSTNAGRGELFRIVPTKGESWVCNDVHVLTLTGAKGTPIEGKIRDVPLDQYLRELEGGGWLADKWYLFRKAVEFPEQPALDVPPYLVGLWMGDGSTGAAAISNTRPEIRDYCRSVAVENGYLLRERVGGRLESPTVTMSFVTQTGTGGASPKCNKFLTFFRTECSYGVYKTLPRRYLTASRRERMELLAGIVDTDGENNKNSFTSVTVTGEYYREDLLFLCRSLGFQATVQSSKTHHCVSGKVSTYYRISISGPLDSLPTRVRKYPPRENPRRVLVEGFTVDPIGEGDYYGFTLDGDGRFLLGDFTVTHNTTFACQFEKPLALVSVEPGGNAGGAKSVKRIEGGTHFRFRESKQVEEFGYRLLRGENPFATVVIDSATSLDAINLTEVCGWDAADVIRVGRASKISTDQYVERGERTRKVLRPYLDLACAVVVICNEKDHNYKADATDQGGSRNPLVRDTKLAGGSLQNESVIGPSLGGGAAKWVGDACDYLCQLYVDKEYRVEVRRSGKEGTANYRETEVVVETGRWVRRLRTSYHPNFVARVRSEVPEVVPDFIEGKSPYDMYLNFMKMVRGELQ